MASAYLRIEIWRPFRSGNSMIQGYSTDDTGEVCYHGRLQEQIYCWQAGADVWFGLEKSTEGQAFQLAITREFQADLPPEKRSVSKLEALLEDLGPHVEAGALMWHDWVQDEDADQLQRGQSIRAFLSHLRWLVRVFGRMPNASVTIR